MTEKIFVVFIRLVVQREVFLRIYKKLWLRLIEPVVFASTHSTGRQEPDMFFGPIL